MVTSFTPPLFSCPIHFHSICSATLIYFFPLNTPYRFLPERLCTSSSLCWNTFSNICMTSSLSFLRNFASQWGLPGPSYLQFNSSPFLTPHLYPNRHSLTPFLLSCSLWYLLAFDILNISPFHWLLYIASSYKCFNVDCSQIKPLSQQSFTWKNGVTIIILKIIKIGKYLLTIWSPFKSFPFSLTINCNCK